MTNETKSDDLDIAISVARRQIETIDRDMAALRQRRAATVHYLATLTGEVIEDLPPEPESGSQSRAARGDSSRAGPALTGRKLNKRIVEEAMEIVARNGRPMTAPEIHTEHSQKEIIGTEALYRLIYNRVISGSLHSLAGAFWPVGKPLPAGWDMSMAKRQHDPNRVRPRRGGKQRA